jgi:16S rRNA (guanine527-N7)-methyltransferase
MNATEAQSVLDVPRETLDRLKTFVEFLAAENDRQNLVARSTLEQVWSRHILDSAQLLRFAPVSAETWLDLGTGAGFPGLIVAVLHPARVTLVELRKLRVDFLQRAASLLGVEGKVDVVGSRVENVQAAPFDVISARAFAPLDKLLALGSRFSTDQTRWILPKGRNAQTELEAAESLWQGEFRLEPSVTDPDASIIVAERVRRRPKERSRP